MTAPSATEDLAEYTRMLGEFVLQQIDLATTPLKKRIFELETRIAEVEVRGVEYLGTHQRAQSYKRGSMVTHDGALWCAVVDVAPNEVPGKSGAWQLAVKSTQEPRSPTRPRAHHHNGG